MRGRDYLNSKKYLAECLAILKEKCEGGNKAAILKALHQCFLMNAPVPRWLSRAFVEAYEAAARREIKSWDEAFGPAQEKGAHLAARKEYADLRFPVALRIALRAPSEKIEPDFFDKIGRELGIGKNKTLDAYYKFGAKQLAENLQPLRRFLRKRRNSGKI
jgi:hypothetical protein